ncbi:MAG: AIPR family protein, partial [Methylocystaceae bacterium]|nr:AIPR family protein [Methylocystaceae bacterium]
MITALDWSAVNTAVENCNRRHSINNLAKAFSYFILENLFPNSDEQIDDYFTDGSNDCGIDAIKIDRNDNQSHVHIFQFKYFSSQKKANHNFPSGETDKVISFIDRLFDKDTTLEKISNPYLWDKILEIWELYQHSSTTFTVYFCSNGQKLDPNRKETLLNSIGKYQVNFEEISFSEIIKNLSSPNSTNTKHKFTAIEKQYLGRSDGDIKGMVATISARDLLQLICVDNTLDRVNPYVFDQNIRVYLGKDNPVNESIVKTALSDKSTYFWYLNNGITAVCSSLAYRDGVRAPVVEIENLQ